MTEQSNRKDHADPTTNVRELIDLEKGRTDDLRKIEVKRIDGRIEYLKEYFDLRVTDTVLASNQRFEAQQLALKDALISQEKAVAAALEGTKEAINKADATTDKRFDLLSEKIDGVVETISKNVGEQGVYVTHTDLSVAMDKLQTNIEATLRPVVTFMNSQIGKETVTDPAMTKLTRVVEDLVGTKSQGISTSWAVLLGAVGFIATILTIFFALSK